MKTHAYYSRPDVQKELLRICKDREVQVWFGSIMGRRPDIIQFVGDFKALIRKGMTSLHVSEERWEDPLSLKPGMSKKVLDENRKGWDLCLDIDGGAFEYSRIVADLLVELLKFYDVKNYHVKFSGNKGFHIAVPFEAFPKDISGKPIKNYFPEGVRILAEYMCFKIKTFLKERLEKLLKKEIKDPFELVDVDSVLISSRHLFRAPYVFNEKSGLVSVVVKDIKNFKRDSATSDNVIVDSSFLNRKTVIEGEARQLFEDAFYWHTKRKEKKDLAKKGEEIKVKREFEMPKHKIDFKFFPPCIQKLFSGLGEDGRKRGVFVGICFLRHAGWGFEEIKEFLLEVNKKHYEPLRDNYVFSQVSWFKRNKNDILPPNCSNEAYYKSMGVCCPDGMCKKSKNPVNYMNRKLFIASHKKTKKKVKKKED